MKNFKLPKGRMISGSKSGYQRRYPFRVPVFNANIVAGNTPEEIKKVWHGDLCLTQDFKEILKLKDDFNYAYVLYESDARFSTEHSPNVNRYLVAIEQGVITLREDLELVKNCVYYKELSSHYLLEDFSPYFENVTDLYQKKNKEGEIIDIPESFKDNFSYEGLNSFFSKYLLDNINLVKSGKISFYHDSLRGFYLEEVIGDLKDELSDPYSLWADVNEFVKNDKNPKDLILFLYENKEDKDCSLLLNKLLHIDFFYVAVNENMAKMIYEKDMENIFKKGSANLFAPEVKEFEKVIKEGNLDSCKKLLTLLTKKGNDYKLSTSKNKKRARDLMGECYREYFSFIKQNPGKEDMFSVLVEINSYLKSSINKAVSFSILENLEDGKMMVPHSGGIIF